MMLRDPCKALPHQTMTVRKISLTILDRAKAKDAVGLEGGASRRGVGTFSCESLRGQAGGIITAVR